MKDAITRLNPKIPFEARDAALKKILRVHSPKLLVNNEIFHDFLVNGIKVEYRYESIVKGDIVKLDVKRLLKRYRYPLDKQKMAIDLVVEQAEVLSDKWRKSDI